MTSTARPFRQVDVFGSRPLMGNPLAVVHDAQGLDDDTLQRFARWTNLSETTFLLPPTDPRADYRVRIFTPGGELPFAGHPTLGTCHAWLEAGHRPARDDQVVQQCGLGLVRVRRSGRRLFFAAPPSEREQPDPQRLAEVLQALGVPASRVHAARLLVNGPAWLTLLLDESARLAEITPDHSRLKALGAKVAVAVLRAVGEEDAAAGLLIARSNREARAFGTAAAAPDARAEPALEVRAFAAPIGVEEDPVTGSLNASLAQWLLDEGRLRAPYVASQGRALGRDGLVFVERDRDGQVWIGGDCFTCVQGQLTL